jgi:hypothetical protein
MLASIRPAVLNEADTPAAGSAVPRLDFTGHVDPLTPWSKAASWSAGGLGRTGVVVDVRDVLELQPRAAVDVAGRAGRCRAGKSMLSS